MNIVTESASNPSIIQPMVISFVIGCLITIALLAIYTRMRPSKIKYDCPAVPHTGTLAKAAPPARIQSPSSLQVVDSAESMAHLKQQIAQGKVIVTFSQHHCPACKAFKPVYEAYAKKSDRPPLPIVRVDGVNAETQAFFTEHGIRQIPTLGGFVNGTFHKMTKPKTMENLDEFVKTIMSM